MLTWLWDLLGTIGISLEALLTFKEGNGQRLLSVLPTILCTIYVLVESMFHLIFRKVYPIMAKCRIFQNSDCPERTAFQINFIYQSWQHWVYCNNLLNWSIIVPPLFCKEGCLSVETIYFNCPASSWILQHGNLLTLSLMCIAKMAAVYKIGQKSVKL